MDRSTKLIFALIAAGLWANIVATIIRPAQAQTSEEAVWLGRLTLELQSVAKDFHALVSGGLDCKNPKLCP